MKNLLSNVFLLCWNLLADVVGEVNYLYIIYNYYYYIINYFQGFGYQEIASVSKSLMCGDVGLGAMAPVDTIVDRVVTELGEGPKLSTGST